MSNFSVDIEKAQEQRKALARRSPYLFPEFVEWQKTLRERKQAEDRERVAREKWETVIGASVLYE